MSFKNTPIIYLARKMWQFSKGNRKQVLLFFSLFIFSNVIDFSQPLIVAKVLNLIQTKGIDKSNWQEIVFYLSLFILVSIGFWLFHGPARVIETRNAFLVRANFKNYLLEGTMDLPSEWHVDHHSGDTIDKIEKATNALYDFSCSTFELIQTFILLLSSYLALVYFNHHASYIVLGMVLLTSFIILSFDKVLIRQYRELYRAENYISAKIFDTISNITTVIILRIERLLTKEIYKKIMLPFRLHVKNSKINEVKWFLVTLAGSIMVFLVLSSYIYVNVQAGSIILIGTVYALYGYLNRIQDAFYRFAYMYSDVVRRKTAVVNVEEIMDKFKEKRTDTEINLDDSWQKIKIKNLQFSYHSEKGKEMHLDNISLTIKKGERIALIGASGSGKTTLLKIIRDLYTPQNVSVFLDDNLLKNGFQSVSHSVVLIPQEPEIFATTIRENITMGVGHTKEEIRKFSDLACFTEVAERLPRKYDSSVVEKGVNLSGGEKQRLALARGLIVAKDRSLILLDEPTSSVDFKNELEIYQNIFSYFRGQTIISTIHRLHLLPMFDEIYFFKKGKIISGGTLSELLNNCQEFKNIWLKYNKTKSNAKEEVIVY